MVNDPRETRCRSGELVKDVFVGLLACRGDLLLYAALGVGVGRYLKNVVKGDPGIPGFEYTAGLKEPVAGAIIYGDLNFTQAGPEVCERLLRRCGIIYMWHYL